MYENKLQKRIADLKTEIDNLPAGSVTKKTIEGKVYYYHRVSVSGKRTETYLDFDAVEPLREQIKKRKQLEAELKSLKQQAGHRKSDKAKYKTSVRTGNELKKFVKAVQSFKKRSCYEKLRDYIYGDLQDRVFILYGLRRTGKTTLIRQLIGEMSNDELARTAFIQISSKDTLADVNADLKKLEMGNYKYIFIDEVTLLADFIEGAALFSDVYASCGMKIVLSGTDSLGFLLSSSDQLYDRCVMLHTTFIPYREFENVLGIKGIDEYIRYGGTMSLSGVHYNDDFVFADKSKTDSYVDSAIAGNIQHSLKYYQNGSHFRHLLELYEKNELTSAINRVVEDINHRFTAEVLTRDFSSGDLSISARNLRRDRNEPNDILDRIDRDAFTDNLKKLLEILNESEQKIKVAEVHASEIREYLKLLDLIYEIEKRSFPNISDKGQITVISQPGLRYAQAEALVNSLLLDAAFNNLSLTARNNVLERILSEIKGRMMEDIVLLETMLANPKKEVFKLQFAVGEIDMVVFDPEALSCKIYEIKHSTEIAEQQYRYLVDADKCKDIEFRFGPITERTVIYRGENANLENGVKYQNVEEYLSIL